MQADAFCSRGRLGAVAFLVFSFSAAAMLGGCAAPAVSAQTVSDERPVQAESALTDLAPEPDAQDAESAAVQERTQAPVLQTGIASYYAQAFRGRRTASGERYDARMMTAAHRSLPIGSYVRVTDAAARKSVIVRINDRGPFVQGRVIDLSFAAATLLGLRQRGAAPVTLEPLSADEARSARAATTTATASAGAPPRARTRASRAAR
jgi:rare lipoprotein A